MPRMSHLQEIELPADEENFVVAAVTAETGLGKLDNSRARQVLLVGDAPDMDGEPTRAIPWPATQSLLDVGYIIRHTSVVLTTDTAAVHIASCFDTPVLVLYRNPRARAKFLPLSESDHVLVGDENHLASISVDEVRTGLQLLLGKDPE